MNKIKERSYFVYDPDGDGFMYYATEEERDKEAAAIINGYFDHSDGWCRDVGNVVAGELTHSAQECDIKWRPTDEELDEDGCDEDGDYWDDYDYKCNYKLTRLRGDNKMNGKEAVELQKKLLRLSKESPLADDMMLHEQAKYEEAYGQGFKDAAKSLPPSILLRPLNVFVHEQGGITKAAKILGLPPQGLVCMRKAKKPVYVDEKDRKVYGLLREY